MLNNLQIRSNCRIINMVTTYSSDAGDNPITDINFGIVFENDDFVPTTGTQADDSTTTTTKVLYIKDKIAEALYASHTELMTVFNPTSGAGLIQNTEVSVGPVMLVSQDEILDGITVAEVAGFRSNVDAETPTDNALTYSAE